MHFCGISLGGGGGAVLVAGGTQANVVGWPSWDAPQGQRRASDAYQAPPIEFN